MDRKFFLLLELAKNKIMYFFAENEGKWALWLFCLLA